MSWLSISSCTNCTNQLYDSNFELFIFAFDSSSSYHFGINISIKLQEKSYLLWNQQVENVILAQRVHKVVVNPWVPQKFKMTQDQAEGNVYDEYEEWIVQDQIIFI